MDIIWASLIIFKFYTMQNYVADDVVLIWQLVDDITIDYMDILHIKIITYSGS
jgi:hypothetical protein